MTKIVSWKIVVYKNQWVEPLKLKKLKLVELWAEIHDIS